MQLDLTSREAIYNFLLEAWESLSRYFLSLFLSNKAPTDFLEFVKGWVRSFPTSQDQQNAHRNLKQLMVDVLDAGELTVMHFNVEDI